VLGVVGLAHGQAADDHAADGDGDAELGADLLVEEQPVSRVAALEQRLGLLGVELEAGGLGQLTEADEERLETLQRQPAVVVVGKGPNIVNIRRQQSPTL
jgi:hypothetical protein